MVLSLLSGSGSGKSGISAFLRLLHGRFLVSERSAASALFLGVIPANNPSTADELGCEGGRAGGLRGVTYTTPKDILQTHQCLNATSWESSALGSP
jgi:hypothetical protein